MLVCQWRDLQWHNRLGEVYAALSTWPSLLHSPPWFSSGSVLSRCCWDGRGHSAARKRLRPLKPGCRPRRSGVGLEVVCAFDHPGRNDSVVDAELLEYVHPFHHIAEDRVAPIHQVEAGGGELRLIQEEEELG